MNELVSESEAIVIYSNNLGAQILASNPVFCKGLNILTHAITSLQAQLVMDKYVQRNYKVEKC
jgi:hypothetical protein